MDSNRCIVMGMKLCFDQQSLNRLCRERGISRLEVFGSVLREDFRPDSGVDLNVVWNTVEADLPPLITQVEAYLAVHPPDKPPAAGPD